MHVTLWERFSHAHPDEPEARGCADLPAHYALHKACEAKHVEYQRNLDVVQTCPASALWQPCRVCGTERLANGSVPLCPLPGLARERRVGKWHEASA